MTTFTARCPEDVLAVAPVVLGFEPSESVVMLTFGTSRAFHARIDLPARGDPTRHRAALAELADALLRPVRRHRVPTVLLLIYTADVRAADSAWRVLRRRCDLEGVHIIDALVVGERRYHPLLARDRGLRETGVAYDVATHPFRTQAVLDGAVVHRSRGERIAVLEPDQEAMARIERILAERRSAPLDDRHAWLAAGRRVSETVAERVAASTPASDEEVADLVSAIRSPRVRDAAWCLLRRANAREHLDLWVDVARRTPRPLSAPPLGLVAYAAWLSGDGALAWAAVDRCREVDPDHGLARLVAEGLDNAVPPDLAEPDFDWIEGWDAG
jgi:hypothetical protein